MDPCSEIKWSERLGKPNSVNEKIRTQYKGRATKKAAEEFNTNERYVEDCAKGKADSPEDCEKIKADEVRLAQV